MWQQKSIIIFGACRAKLSTTQIYTHVDIEARKNNISKLAY